MGMRFLKIRKIWYSLTFSLLILNKFNSAENLLKSKYSVTQLHCCAIPINYVVTISYGIVLVFFI